MMPLRRPVAATMAPPSTEAQVDSSESADRACSPVANTLGVANSDAEDLYEHSVDIVVVMMATAATVFETSPARFAGHQIQHLLLFAVHGSSSLHFCQDDSQRRALAHKVGRLKALVSFLDEGDAFF